jgi:hypothetical protein
MDLAPRQPGGRGGEQVRDTEDRAKQAKAEDDRGLQGREVHHGWRALPPGVTPLCARVFPASRWGVGTRRFLADLCHGARARLRGSSARRGRCELDSIRIAEVWTSPPRIGASGLSVGNHEWYRWACSTLCGRRSVCRAGNACRIVVAETGFCGHCAMAQRCIMPRNGSSSDALHLQDLQVPRFF